MLHRLRRLMPRGKQSLQTRFQIGLASILFIFCLIAVVAVYSLQRNMLEREALRQTELVMRSLQATRQYVRETLRPKMYEALPEDSFMLESMSSSYITRVIAQNLRSDLPEFGYRRVAEDPRNPEFAPLQLERKMIRYFREHQTATSWSGVIRQGTTRQFIRFEPVRYRESCLLCHGQPSAAPPDIVMRYGEDGGFYKQSGEIGGVVSVFIPLDQDLAGIRTSILWLFCGIGGAGFLLFLFIRLFFQQLVIVNLHELLSFFRETVTDAKGSALYLAMASKDELSEMSEGTRLLATHIRNTRLQLEDYAATLEEKVALRTEALERSHDQLRLQVNERNRELQLFTVISELTSGSGTLPAILHQVLQETLEIIPCTGGAIYLSMAGHFSLCCASNVIDPPSEFVIPDTPESDETDRAVTGCDFVHFLDDEERAAIPLCCRNRTRGVLVISRLDNEKFTEPLMDLLIAIGHQIGIAIESLQTTGALRSSEQLLSSIFKGISDPLVLLDPQGRFQMVNSAFLEYHMLKRSETIGRSAESLGRRGCFLKSANSLQHLKAPYPRNETVRDQRGKFFDLHFYPVIEKDGEIVSVICFARDVTEIRQVEHQMRQAEKLAAVGQLAAGVAHEINNPLWVILCHTDIVKAAYPEAFELIQDIETIERHAKHCHQIISELLNFTRYSGDEPVKQAEDMHELIKHVLGLLHTQFVKKGIKVLCSLDSGDPHCLVNSSRLQQVLMNLLMNAGQAIGANSDPKSGATIQVRTTISKSTLHINIEDNGSGIPSDIKERIFDPFFTTKQPGEGTGLGLSVSYGIIQEHGGSIAVSSQPGQTVFTIILPLHRGNPENSL